MHTTACWCLGTNVDSSRVSWGVTEAAFCSQPTFVAAECERAALERLPLFRPHLSWRQRFASSCIFGDGRDSVSLLSSLTHPRRVKQLVAALR